jgi:hypothetical protein
MALTLEDGSCVPTANAFVSRAALIAFAADYHPATTVGDDTTTDAAIMRASAWLSTFPDWDGSMTCGRGLQGLAWPRKDVTDCNGDEVPDDEVPQEVEMATFVAALAELESPGILTPSITPGQVVKRVKVDVIEEEYMTPRDQGINAMQDAIETLRPVLTAVTDLLRCMATLPDGKSIPWPWVA